MIEQKFTHLLVRYLILLGLFVFGASSVNCAWYDDVEWYDDFYQYRIPIEVNHATAGIQKINITTDQIVASINAIENVPCTSAYFEFNNVIIVEYDAFGNLMGKPDTGGYYISEDGPNLVQNGDFETWPGAWSYYAGPFTVVPGESYNGSQALKVESDVVNKHMARQGPISITNGDWYVLKWWTKHAANTYNTYVNITKDNETSGTVKRTSHIPALSSKYWTQYQALYHADESAISLNIYRSITGKQYFDDVEFHHADIELLIDPSGSGLKRYMLYYQPTDGQKPNMPEKKIAAQPAANVTPGYIGSARRYENLCRYTLETNPDYDIFFAETTQKISPTLATPSVQKSAVSVSCARNERQSFQIVLNPKSTMNLTSVTASALTTGSDTIISDSITYKHLKYVFMTQPSEYAHGLVPQLADPMVDFAPRSLDAGDSVVALWFTIHVASGKSSGVYSGTIELAGDVGGAPFTEQIPVNLEVYAFAIPERIRFQTSHAGKSFGITYDSGSYTVYDYHGISSLDYPTLVEMYFDYMCDNRVYPFTVGYGVIIDYEIDAPPGGYNIDLPGNYFYLYDFDFSDYNTRMSRYIDQKKVNAFTVLHTNGAVSNRINTPMGQFGWDKEAGDAFTEVTQLQFNNLIIDYFRELAYDLIINGWIDYAYISFDETGPDDFERMINFCDALSSDPFASQIAIQHDLNRTAAHTYKTNPESDTEIAMKSRIDIWCPGTGMLGTYYEDHYYTERGLDFETTDIWQYTSHSPYTYIDVPGLTNRIQPVTSYYMHGRGYLTWNNLGWDAPTYSVVNPWIDPYCLWGNGVLSFFYPPGDTVASSPDFTLTPSLRIELLREGIEDFEYLTLLEEAAESAAAAGIDTSTAESLFTEYRKMFPDWVHWTTNDEYYVRVRNQVGEEVEKLNWYITYGPPEAQIIKIARDGSNVNISLYAKEIYRYNLLRSNDLANPSWQVVDTALVNAADTITLTDNSIGGTQKAFYKIQAVIP